ISPEIELVRPIDPYPALAEKICKHAVHDRCADLTFDIVANDREFCFFETLAPITIGRNENRNAVHEGAASLNCTLRVILRGRLGADREIGYEDVCSGIP